MYGAGSILVPVTRWMSSCGSILAAMAVDLLTQPGKPGGELTPADLLWQIGDIGIDQLPELGGRSGFPGHSWGSSRSCHPTSAHPGGLHAASSGWGDAQILLEAGVPGFGQVLHSQTAFHHGHLQLHAQHDVQVVGGFIGFHPDERRLDLVDALVEGIQ